MATSCTSNVSSDVHNYLHIAVSEDNENARSAVSSKVLCDGKWITEDPQKNNCGPVEAVRENETNKTISRRLKKVTVWYDATFQSTVENGMRYKKIQKTYEAFKGGYAWIRVEKDLIQTPKITTYTRKEKKRLGDFNGSFIQKEDAICIQHIMVTFPSKATRSTHSTQAASKPVFKLNGRYNIKVIDDVMEALDDFHWGLVDDCILELKTSEDLPDITAIKGLFETKTPAIEMLLKMVHDDFPVQQFYKREARRPLMIQGVIDTQTSDQTLSSSNDKPIQQSPPIKFLKAEQKETYAKKTTDSTATSSGWGVKDCLKVAAGCGGVALALFAAYKYFRT